MEMPSLNFLFILAMINITMFTLSYGFAEAGFYEGSVSEWGMTEFPDLEFGSLEDIKDTGFGLFAFIAGTISTIISLMFFTIPGIPALLSFVLLTPLYIVNGYAMFMIGLKIAEVVGGYIPFT